MSAIDLASLRRLYREACHGAGAEPRRTARAQIDEMLAHHRVTLREAFEIAGLDLSAYFASRPIG